MKYYVPPSKKVEGTRPPCPPPNCAHASGLKAERLKQEQRKHENSKIKMNKIRTENRTQVATSKKLQNSSFPIIRSPPVKIQKVSRHFR